MTDTSPEQIQACRWCDKDAVGTIAVDPYDYISGSPILQPSDVCITCYNRRVIAAVEWVLKHRLEVKS